MNQAFERVYRETILQIEGGYANDPDDPGRETYRGISRKYHPQWSGWQLIDGMKTHPGFPRVLDTVPELQRLVKSFYWDEFWLRLGGGVLQPDELVASLFDIGVNMGQRRALNFLQRSLNVLNKRGQQWDDLVVDNKLGPVTRDAVAACRVKGSLDRLLKCLEILQGHFYIDACEKQTAKEKYLGGWLDKRVVL